MSVKDRQGNVSRLERTFKVVPLADESALAAYLGRYHDETDTPPDPPGR